MDMKKLIGIILIVAGALALAYGGFTYTEETHEADVGPINIAVEDKERVNIPVWAGLAAVLVGGALLLVGRKS